MYKKFTMHQGKKITKGAGQLLGDDGEKTQNQSSDGETLIAVGIIW